MPTISDVRAGLANLGIHAHNPAASDGLAFHFSQRDEIIPSISPVDGEVIAHIQLASDDDYEAAINAARAAFPTWRDTPAPLRGEIVRQIGEAFRAHKSDLGALVSYEMGKIYQEGLGEVQEIIDICDFAVGLSRQLYGLTITTERPRHRMYEQWHPLGVVGIISAFNFPVAVWSWNAMIAAVCGNTTLWKPSEKTPLCAIACMHIISDVLRRNHIPAGVFGMINGDADVGRKLASDHRVNLISATGSVPMGRSVGCSAMERMGKSLLELGGNNAIIVSDKADLALALPAIVFAAVGTAGQRCTSARRLFVHASIYDSFKAKLVSVYEQVAGRVGNPLDAATLVGPLIDPDAVRHMQDALAQAKSEGGVILTGGHVLEGDAYATGTYVAPALVEAQPHFNIVHKETFAPILYLMRYETLEQAIAAQNAVPQGLSSSIFTNDLREAETFLSAAGSDCGIANVNIGPSGAEIGGAFGGEKETGGGRESGSDAWKAYMRRQTVTINYDTKLTLAQGIQFDV